MNNFDMVFQELKNNVAADGVHCTLTSLEKIARKTQLRVDRVEFYAGCLESMGLVICNRNKTVCLTTEGIMKNAVFS